MTSIENLRVVHALITTKSLHSLIHFVKVLQTWSISMAKDVCTVLS